MSVETLIAAQDIRFRYPGSSVFSVDGISHEWVSGKGVHALMGANGSGKSTLMKIMAGLLEPESGKLLLEGKPLRSFSAVARASRIAYVPSELPVALPLSVREVVQLGRVPYVGSSLGSRLLGVPSREDVRITDENLERCHVTGLKDRLYQSLSSGEKQRVILAQALSRNAGVYLFDETFSRMDLNHQVLAGKILRDLSSEDRLVIFVSHDLNFLAEWADEVVVLEKGKRAASGAVSETLSPDLLKAIYPGIHAVVGKNPISDRAHVFLGAQK